MNTNNKLGQIDTTQRLCRNDIQAECLAKIREQKKIIITYRIPQEESLQV